MSILCLVFATHCISLHIKFLSMIMVDNFFFWLENPEWKCLGKKLNQSTIILLVKCNETHSNNCIYLIRHRCLMVFEHFFFKKNSIIFHLLLRKMGPASANIFQLEINSTDCRIFYSFFFGCFFFQPKLFKLWTNNENVRRTAQRVYFLKFIFRDEFLPE